MLRSKKHALRILRNAGGELQVHESEKLKNYLNLGKCQHEKKEVAEGRLLQIATKDTAWGQGAKTR